MLLTNPKTLSSLVLKQLDVVAPMLKSDGLYSNFWSGMTSDYYYQRTEDYKPIATREKTGCFPVPMVHTCVLIHLRQESSDLLTYDPSTLKDYDGPQDDIITFALSANLSGVPLHVCNDELFGYVTVPLEQSDGLERDVEQLVNVKLEALADGAEPFKVVDAVKEFVKLRKKDKMRFDKIYMINLKRRSDRRRRMHAAFDELGLDAETVDAVDGR